ncbi:MAG: 1-acyl-sn-glycerol-3-phosphate acyltransferase [Ruminococcaceae bacterium]|nr:1-acyl-sn-glycerol-3-phosphate acyltransferase [Oscillospiraceae bacterium]
MSEAKNVFYRRIHWLLAPVVRLFFPLDVRGREHLTDEAVVLCPNHSSALDPILLACALRYDMPLRIMAKKQLMDIPVLGWFLGKMGAFGVDRGNSDIGAIKTSIRSLRDGWKLMIFPEGTRVKEGQEVDAKGGAAMIAIRSGVQMQPVFIGTKKRLFRKTKIVFGPVYAPVYTGKKGTAEEYQANVEEVMRQVKELGEAT